MSGVRVVVGTRNGLIGNTTSPDHPLTQTAALPRNLAAGLDT